MKMCPQCGRNLQETSFRPYHYQSSTAVMPCRNTICKDCANFNLAVNRAYHANPRTPYQQRLVEEATDIYKDLLARGLEPRGKLVQELGSRATAAQKYKEVITNENM